MVMISRSYDEAHATALAGLHAATVSVAYRHIFPPDSAAPTGEDLADSWRSLLRDPKVTVLVAYAGDGLVGSVVFGPNDSTPCGFSLSRLHVHPDHQGQGVGTALHDRVLAAATSAGLAKLNLWVLEHNERARAMYEGRGWVLVPGPTFPNDPPHIIDVLYERSLATS